MKIKKILRNIVNKFESKNIDFCLIGAFALLKYGIERGTRDIDFMIHDDDIQKVQKIMQELTYEPIQISNTFSQYESPLEFFGNIDSLHEAYISGNLELDLDKIKYYYIMFNKQDDFNEMWLREL